MNIITWNMQGSNASTENKWNTGVANILNSIKPTPVVCLQECGGVPASAQPLNVITFPLATGGNDFVYIFAWGGTRSRPGYYIIFHNWDVNGNRVNSAIVTNALPANTNDFMLISPTVGPTWRPALGININGTWVFSFHAISPGGVDGPGLLNQVAQFCANTNSNWLVAGDWNNPPNALNIPGGSVICPPNGNTFSVIYPNAQYDYCVCSGTNAVTGTVLQPVIMSDHYPVAYGF
jgi:cytolethal distending toxin subunit B